MREPSRTRPKATIWMWMIGREFFKYTCTHTSRHITLWCGDNLPTRNLDQTNKDPRSLGYYRINLMQSISQFDDLNHLLTFDRLRDRDTTTTHGSQLVPVSVPVSHTLLISSHVELASWNALGLVKCSACQACGHFLCLSWNQQSSLAAMHASVFDPVFNHKVGLGLGLVGLVGLVAWLHICFVGWRPFHEQRRGTLVLPTKC